MSVSPRSAEPPTSAAVRVAMPGQLRDLAGVTGEVVVEVEAPVTVRAAIDALEAAHPRLVGAIRDRGTGHRRAMIRIYGAGEDLSNQPPETMLPDPVTSGREPLRLVGAIAGG